MGGIGSKSFYNCENLGGIEIPNTVTGIGSGCFQNCSSLAYAIIGSGVSDLPEYCFYGCSSLPEIAIPATVKRIGNNVFYGCTTLARVDIEDRQSELSLGYNSDYSSSDQRPLFSDCPLDSVYIGGNISYATGSDSGYSPFYRNTSLRAVKITDQETEISENEFYGCTGLTTVELGDGIESIGNYAFSGCSALDSFSFGHSVTTIGEEAFSDCTAMTRLQSRAEVPPVCGNQALDDINKWTCELFVPTKSLDAYKAADQWKEFFFITGEDYDKPGSVDAVSENGGVSVATYRDSIEIIGADNAVITVYNTNGQLVYSGTDTTIGGLARGVYIVQVGGQTFKVVL
ncbi:MAG TPA: leucine-rich repeat protein [Candidatus Limisoma gallistercoris]|nr:leucine-rich repeat protein [Candidatus Limisoma gallistercoris]